MGQKIHPIGFRLAVNKNWGSRWYANSKNFGAMLNEDLKVRDFLKKKLAHASVGRVVIERPAKDARITIYSARPGVVIGKKGEDIEVLKAELRKILGVQMVHVNIEEIREDSVVLTDGTVLPADLIVYATGYGSMNGWAARLISQEVADRVGKCWGLGSATTKDPGPWEGELRNMWKPTQQPALWFHGGNLHQSRHYSLYLALQIKARQEGLPIRVYGISEIHHRE